MLPLVTINILTYNRKDELRNTLRKIYEQDYKNIEVIVVDNASTDGTSEMVEKEYETVQVLKLQQNRGVEGWNEGLKYAAGNYILLLDDDAYPEKDSIKLAVQELNDSNKYACVAFNLKDLETNTYHYSNWLPKQPINITTDWPVFIGCAAMFRLDRINIKQFVPDGYFLYQHELPMSADIYNSGYYIAYNSSIMAYHRFKPRLYRKLNDIYIFKNNLRFILEYFPEKLRLFHSFHLSVYYLSRAIRKCWLKEYICLLWDSRKIKPKNQKISLHYYTSLKRLQLFDFSILGKFHESTFHY